MLKQADMDDRLGFIRKVYGILAVQLLLTVGIVTPFQRISVDWMIKYFWVQYVTLAVFMVVMCGMVCCTGALRTYPTNYVYLFIMTTAMSVLVGFVTATYTWQSVVLALGITVGVFLMLTVVACCFKIDLTGMLPFILAISFTFMLFSFAIIIMSLCGIRIEWMIMVYDILGVLIFSVYIVFDTQLIMGSYGGHKIQFSIDDYCFAALMLYLDIVQMFLFLLELVGSRK